MLRELCDRFNIKPSHSAAYHPQCNRLAGRLWYFPVLHSISTTLTSPTGITKTFIQHIVCHWSSVQSPHNFIHMISWSSATLWSWWCMSYPFSSQCLHPSLFLVAHFSTWCVLLLCQISCIVLYTRVSKAHFGRISAPTFTVEPLRSSSPSEYLHRLPKIGFTLSGSVECFKAEGSK